MTTKEDISKFVSFHPVQKALGQIYYLSVDVKTVNNTELNNRAAFPTILKATVECKLTEEEMVKEVDSLLTSFEPFRMDPVTDRTVTEDEVSFKIQAKCRRGIGNTRYKNSIYYKGIMASDSPVIVAEFDDKYAVFKHPNFEKYGFVIEKEEPKDKE